MRPVSHLGLQEEGVGVQQKYLKQKIRVTSFSEPRGAWVQDSNVTLAVDQRYKWLQLRVISCGLTAVPPVSRFPLLLTPPLMSLEGGQGCRSWEGFFSPCVRNAMSCL